MTDIKPVAWTSKKGLRHLARSEFLSVGKNEDRERNMPLYGPEAADEITRLHTLLSEAEKHEREAREKLQAMHRRAQESERVEQMVVTTMKMYDKYITVGVRSHRILFKIVLRDLLRSAEKIRSRSALQSEER